jgi:hypothetical protein
MNQLTEESKKHKHLTENDILKSLENAISAYSDNDFESIKSELPPCKLKKIKAKEQEEVKLANISKKKKSKKVKKSSKKSSRKYKGIFSLLSKRKRTVLLPERTKGKSVGIISKYRRQLVSVALSLVMVSFVGLTSYVAYAYVTGSNNGIVEKVSAHVVLPIAESPKVYIIQSEKSEIFQNPLFKGITVGDNVLTYTRAGKVYIYRGSDDKIVNIVNTTQ